MCGIIAVKQLNGRPAVDKVLSQYLSQKSRGQQGFGFIEILKNRITLRRFVYEIDALTELKKSKASEIIFHHRIPTSTMNSALCNQPIIVTSEAYKHNYYIFHNGVVSNCDELKKKHEEMGIRYSSVKDDEYNDSEALGHELALVIEGIKEKKDFDVGGSLAFILLQTDKNNVAKALFYGRNYTNPLTLTVVEDMFMEIRSAGGAQEITPHKLYRYDYEKQIIENIEFNFSKLFTAPSTPLALPQARDAIYDGIDADLDATLNKIEPYTAEEAGLGKEPSSWQELYAHILEDRLVDFISLLRLDKEPLLRLMACARSRRKELLNDAVDRHTYGSQDEENNLYFIAGMQKKNMELILRAIKSK